MPKKYIKSKSKPNMPGPGFRTPSNFRSKSFSPGGNRTPKFNPGLFKTQHKG